LQIIIIFISFVPLFSSFFSTHCYFFNHSNHREVHKKGTQNSSSISKILLHVEWIFILFYFIF
jgi:hypothetical protein